MADCFLFFSSIIRYDERSCLCACLLLLHAAWNNGRAGGLWACPSQDKVQWTATMLIPRVLDSFTRALISRNENIYFPALSAAAKGGRQPQRRWCLTSGALSLRLTPRVPPTSHLGQPNTARRRPGIGLNRQLPATRFVRRRRQRPGWSWLHGLIIPLPRRMDNRSQCNRARPTPTGRLFVIGFTWRSSRSAPEANYSNHCETIVPAHRRRSLFAPYHNLSCQAASRWAPGAVREVDTPSSANELRLFIWQPLHVANVLYRVFRPLPFCPILSLSLLLLTFNFWTLNLTLKCNTFCTRPRRSEYF